jgi:hypothetical protein
MGAVITVCAMFLFVFTTLGFYALHKMKPGSVKVRATLSRIFTFNIEIESSETAKHKDAGAITGNGKHHRPLRNSSIVSRKLIKS